jgi:hypothetical protein
MRTGRIFLLWAIRGVVAVAALITFTASSAPAQSLAEPNAWVYAFGGVGGVSDGDSAFLHAGGGGEALLIGGFGIGGELGYFAPFSEPGDGVGLLSVDPAYHFGRSNKLVPFIAGGYSLAFRGGVTSSGGNFGGGVQYWLGERAALRVEFRDHIFSSDNAHLFSFRFGLAFR